MRDYVSAKTLLADLSKVDYLEYGNIQLPWSDYVKQCNNVAKDNPDYNDSPIDSEPRYKESKDAFSVAEQWKSWGYTRHNTQVWKNTSGIPKIDFKWEKDIADRLPLSEYTVTPTRQEPGHVLPWHRDHFVFFRQKYTGSNIIRFLIFMEDNDIGHALQIGNVWKTNWKAGDVIVWYPDTQHLSINIGKKNKWTCNVTGVLYT